MPADRETHFPEFSRNRRHVLGLMIPGVIFSESSFSYLKIIDLTTSGLTSIGTMLSEGQRSFTTYPNLIIWPALFISLLMICFNIFGNGLRDAFNPTLRGAEE
jgi:oligopeptide transport system permease protein